MKVGKLEIEIIDAGRFKLDAGASFGMIPKVMWERVVTPDEKNRIPFALNCLLIKSGSHNILVDTGIGTKLSQKNKDIFEYQPNDIVEELAKKGVKPEDIYFVINTHLHFDHCGGNTVEKNGQIVPAFPFARYIVQAREWNDATHPNDRTKGSYMAENFMPIKDAEQLELIEGPSQVTPEVECLITPGHTSTHQSVLISSDGMNILFLGDMVQFAVQMERLPWVSAFDLEPLVSMETKRWVMQKAEENGWILIFQHDTQAGYTIYDKVNKKLKPYV